MCDGSRFADAAGFYHYVVEPVEAAEVAELRNQVHLQSAAYATVLKCYQTVVRASDNAALLYQVGIYVDLADVVDDYGELDSFLVCEDAVQKGGLAAPEVSGHKKDRDLLFFVIDCHNV